MHKHLLTVSLVTASVLVGTQSAPIDTFESIQTDVITAHPECSAVFSSQAAKLPLKSLLKYMLHPSAANRPSFRKICDSDWLRNTKYVMKPPKQDAKKPAAKPSTPKSPDGEKKKKMRNHTLSR